jgi:hypothetical protein
MRPMFTGIARSRRRTNRTSKREVGFAALKERSGSRPEILTLSKSRPLMHPRAAVPSSPQASPGKLLGGLCFVDGRLDGMESEPFVLCPTALVLSQGTRDGSQASQRASEEPGAAPLGFCGEPSDECRLCQLMALSWLNLPCALKAVMMGDPASLPRHRGRRQGPRASPRAIARPEQRRGPIASTRPRRRSAALGTRRG